MDYFDAVHVHGQRPIRLNRPNYAPVMHDEVLALLGKYALGTRHEYKDDTEEWYYMMSQEIPDEEFKAAVARLREAGYIVHNQPV